MNATGRNINPTDRFVRLPHRILTSEAYRSLDLTARCLLVELVMIENGKNNGSLWLSVDDATKRLGLAGASPIIRAFRDLQERGFLRVTKDAHFQVKAAETSRARCWRITWLSWELGPATNDWEKYIAPPKSKERKRVDRANRAMKHWVKGTSSGKFPVVNFTALEAPVAALIGEAVTEFETGIEKNDRIPAFPVGMNFEAHTAATIPKETSGSLWWANEHIWKMRCQVAHLHACLSPSRYGWTALGVWQLNP